MVGATKVMKNKTFKTILLLVIALVAWGWKWYQERQGAGVDVSKPSALEKNEDEKVGGYYLLKGCRLVPDKKYNDGDSFKVKAKDGRVFELRIYYVDTAESRDKPYDDHRRRVMKQGEAFGGLGYEKTLRLGKLAKDFANSKLKGIEFDVLTKWEVVYDGPRVYGFLKLPSGEYWHELLVKEGLGRVHTKGVTLPEGRKYHDQKRQLQKFAANAKSQRKGGWGLN